jgi:hypothetical protein
MTTDEIGAERRRRLAASPLLADVIAHPPEFRTPAEVFAALVVGLGLAAVAAFPLMLSLHAESGGDSARNGLRWDFPPDRPMLVTFAVACFACLLVAGWGFVHWRRFNGRPRVPAPVAVVAKRSEPGTRSGAYYYMTFETESGERTEGFITVDEFGWILPGDVGVAWFQDGRFVGFRKAEIDPSAV